MIDFSKFWDLGIERRYIYIYMCMCIVYMFRCLPCCSVGRIYYFCSLGFLKRNWRSWWTTPSPRSRCVPCHATRCHPGHPRSRFLMISIRREQVALTAPPRMNVAMETVPAIISCGYMRANKEEVTVLWDIETIFPTRRWWPSSK